MHSHLYSLLAEAHRDELLRQAKAARLAASTRERRRRAKADFVVRVLEPVDRREIRRLFERMSARSRYLRYLAPVSALPAGTLAQLAAIDHIEHEAVGAFHGDALIGAAHYFISTDDSTAAEMCVEVADRYHRQGVATSLLVALSDRARARGITRFTATVLADNVAILPLARRLDWSVASQTSGSERALGLSLVNA